MRDPLNDCGRDAAAVGLSEARRRGIPAPPFGNTGARTTHFITGSPYVR